MKLSKESLAEWLRSERAKKKISQISLANKAGVSTSMYGMIERAQANVSIDLLLRLGTALGKEIEFNATDCSLIECENDVCD